MPEKVKILAPLVGQDECSYLTDLAIHNKSVDRHSFLLRIGWRHMGDRVGYGLIRRRYYANLNFDNPCLTFTMTEAWFITLFMLASDSGAIARVCYSEQFWKIYKHIPWYERVAHNHWKVD